MTQSTMPRSELPEAGGAKRFGINIDAAEGIGCRELIVVVLNFFEKLKPKVEN